jgi:hypothetical protein
LGDPLTLACDALSLYIQFEGEVANERMAQLDEAWSRRSKGKRIYEESAIEEVKMILGSYCS